MNRFAVKVVAAALCALLSPLARAGTASALVVEDLRCRGNAATSCDFILGHVYLGRGDAVDEAELQNAQLRLATLRTFKSASILLEKGSERGKAIVVVEVEEGDPIAADWVFGASHRLGALASVVAGRVSHQNLFGAGKLADVSVVAMSPLDGPADETYRASLRYADPHLLGSKRYFAIADLSYVDADITDRYGNFFEENELRLRASLGYRLWDFSYLIAGYGYRPRIDRRSGYWNDDGEFETEDDRNRHVIELMYGWNSEDDLYFPTRGSSFHIGGGWGFGDETQGENLLVQFRKTWRAGGGFASVKVLGDPGDEYRQTFSELQFLTGSYAWPIAASEDIRRGRWYIEGGWSPRDNDPTGRQIQEYGIKLGIRVDTRSLGMIDLYILGTWDGAR